LLGMMCLCPMVITWAFLLVSKITLQETMHFTEWRGYLSRWNVIIASNPITMSEKRRELGKTNRDSQKMCRRIRLKFRWRRSYGELNEPSWFHVLQCWGGGGISKAEISWTAITGIVISSLLSGIYILAYSIMRKDSMSIDHPLRVSNNISCK
jgi:hypothetical protein